MNTRTTKNPAPPNRWRYRRAMTLCMVFAFLAVLPLAGQNSAIEWYGPQSFVMGPGYSGGESPYGDAANPAASSWIQRLTLDLSYLLVAGLETEQGFAHQINLGSAIPTNIGVWSFTGQFGTSNLTSLPWGTWFGVNAAFGKDLLDDLAVGIGLNFEYGEFGSGASARADWGLAMDLGFINKVGDVAFLKDFAWGASLKGLGKAMYINGLGTWPDTFTTGVGTSFKVVKEQDVGLGFNFDLDFPMVIENVAGTDTFKPNLRFNTGLDLQLFKIVDIQIGYDLDVQKLIAGTDRTIPLNFGLRFNLGGSKSKVDAQGKPLSFWETSEYKPSIVVAPLRNGLWTFGTGLNMPVGVVDSAPPEIKADTPEEIWISPNFDGVQDDLQIPLQITDERYITGYTLYIYDENGKLVRIISNKEERPENVNIDTLAERFARTKSGIPVPESITWDGQGGQVEETPATEPAAEAPADAAAPADTGANAAPATPAPAAPAATDAQASPAPAETLVNEAPVLTLVTWLGQGESGTTGPVASPAPAATPAPSAPLADGTASPVPSAGPKFKAAPLPDGVYTWVIESVDDNGNVSRTTKRIVHVDSTPPNLKLDAPADKGFAPGGDRPAFMFSQSSSPEESWTGKVLDAEGKVIRTFTWTAANGGLPAQGVWDGRNDANALAKDGLYSYVLTCTDKAGNTASATIDNIMLLNRPTPVNLLVENAWFSPNGDNIKDTVFLSVDANRDVKVDSWKAELLDANGIVVRTQQGRDELPKSITVDGKNDAGKLLAEGRYTLKLDTLYQNGNHPVAQSPELTLDISPPKAELSSEYRLFSPDGDGNKDTVKITQQASAEPQWIGLIRNEQNKEIQRFTWRDKPDASLVWDGKGDNKVLPDGRYTYQISAVDLAGNSGTSNPLEFRVDTRATPISISATRPAFSPNNDTVLDSQMFVFDLGLVEDVESWQLRVVAANTADGVALRSWVDTSLPLEPITWDGKDANGKLVKDGAYQAVAQVIYKKGNAPVVLSRTFDVDTKAPSVTLSTDIAPVGGKVLFSPDGDRNLDTLTFIHKDSSTEDLWNAAILNRSGKVIATWNYEGKMPAQVVWNGADNSGNRLKDDAYTYRVSSTDKAGNKLETDLRDITLDTKPTPVSLKIAGLAFSPNGDKVKDTMDFLPELEVNTEIKGWVLQIQPANGGSARSISKTGPVDEKITWDGKTDGGRLAPEGDYVAKLTVEYLKGNKVEALSPQINLDLTPPKSTAYADASLFSPDGDGQNDKVKITMEASKEPLWKGSVYLAGPLNSKQSKPSSPVPVAEWEWKGQPPASLVWDGASSQGVAVANSDYLFVLAATDEAGNSAESSPVVLQVDNRPVSIALAATEKAFSPNGDTRKDMVKITVSTSLNEGMEAWKLDIKNTKGALVRSIAGQGELPKSFDWDGKDDKGRIALEGDYKAELNVVYFKGNKPKAGTEAFTLDLTPPSLSLKGEDLIFSPDADGRKDVVRIIQKSSPEDLWEGKITDPKGKVVRSLFWKGEAKEFAWDGRDENGNRQDDGVYQYSVSSTDAAGNLRSEKLGGITLDTRMASVLVSASARGFAPGSANTSIAGIKFTPFLGLKDGVDAWTLDLQINNESVYSLNGKGLPPEVINWDGFMGTGANRKMAPEGRYEAVLAVEYVKGNRPEARSTPFVLDVGAPNVQISIAPQPFSPDEDGVDDEVTIGLSVDDPSGIRDWELKILEPDDTGKAGKVFASFSGTGQPTSRIVWYGKSSTGELVQAAEDYRVVLTVTDTLGNKGVYDKEVIPVDVLVIREADGTLRIKIPGISFPSNSSDLKGVEGEKLLKNSKTLDRIAQILRKYASYAITVEGHANITQYWDKAKAERENKVELIPLSQKRAEAVRQALIDRGIPAARLDAMGVGGDRPVVKNNDLDNVWKNRRVEFILRK